MHNDGSGLHHQNIRKRIYEKFEPYPHHEKVKAFVDRIIFPVGILGPLSTAPQIWEIWTTHNVSGLSLFMWIVWIFIAFVWIAYGILHKDIPIILSNILWAAVEISVVIGIFVFQ